MGGELRPKKCPYTIHDMRPTKTGEWEYAKTTPVKQEPVGTTAGELDDLWEDMNAEELEELEPPKPRLPVPLASGDAAVIKKFPNGDAEENLGIKVQPNGCDIRHLEALKDKVETWTSKVDSSQLPARAV